MPPFCPIHDFRNRWGHIPKMRPSSAEPPDAIHRVDIDSFLREPNMRSVQGNTYTHDTENSDNHVAFLHLTPRPEFQLGPLSRTSYASHAFDTTAAMLCSLIITSFLLLAKVRCFSLLWFGAVPGQASSYREKCSENDWLHTNRQDLCHTYVTGSIGCGRLQSRLKALAAFFQFGAQISLVGRSLITSAIGCCVAADVSIRFPPSN